MNINYIFNTNKILIFNKLLKKFIYNYLNNFKLKFLNN